MAKYAKGGTPRARQVQRMRARLEALVIDPRAEAVLYLTYIDEMGVKTRKDRGAAAVAIMDMLPGMQPSPKAGRPSHQELPKIRAWLSRHTSNPGDVPEWAKLCMSVVDQLEQPDGSGE